MSTKTGLCWKHLMYNSKVSWTLVKINFSDYSLRTDFRYDIYPLLDTMDDVNTRLNFVSCYIRNISYLVLIWKVEVILWKDCRMPNNHTFDNIGDLRSNCQKKKTCLPITMTVFSRPIVTGASSASFSRVVNHSANLQDLTGINKRMVHLSNATCLSSWREPAS